ncbi:hypothetical protein LJC09_01740 [Desulfovibrio sp. OttesenSCG-928-F20]|nr:hypothetical protein [Desulfovibrio sp. OttesenSCG-928-F20]
MKLLVPFVLWCAAGLYLIGAYPLSPPGAVPGLSANRLANGLYGLTTLVLIVRAFMLGRSRKGCPLKVRVLRRVTYTWMCCIILCMFLGLNHLVRMNTFYERTSFFVSYLTLLGIMAGILCIIAFYKRRADENARNCGAKDRPPMHETSNTQ